MAGAAVAVDVAGEGEAPRPAVGQLVLARVARPEAKLFVSLRD